ncbi:alpha/beta hydrolase [Streptomyces sp. NBC_01275]|uniref:alpha/beta fold hydrolase n=1 Tax=Streptomyces sp. NBC_01275 TaxID=2903807 RepID=UPI0022586C62|nr:alpha/beta hydrolase [Streptomyces sp. NBC_01275]MCX4760390.1 alpha/beta hydrolase [Streptomyces sp. NBC_01275]
MNSIDHVLNGEAQTIVDGIRQVYRVVGDGPLCLVHSGGPGVHPGYLRMPALEKHLTMIYLDPVGAGDSDLLPDGDYSMSRYAYFAEAVLDDIGASTAYFLGHSHGGFVALQLGIDHPDRVEGLILYDTAPISGQELTDTATKEMAAFVERWPDRPEAAAAVRIWDAAVVSHTLEITDDESHRRFLEGILPAYFADYRKTVERVGALDLQVTHDPDRRTVDWDVRGQLETINVPTLVIVGSHDFICPTRYAYEMAAALPDARICEMFESGHFAHIEEPDVFADAVLDFVRTEQFVGEGAKAGMQA